MARVTLPRPERPRRYVFSLTPLADAMFQLLIFFMLSSNLAPYSLLTLQAAAAGSSQIIGDAAPQEEALPAGDVAVWTLGRSRILTGGEEFPLDEVDALARTGAGAGKTTVVLLTSQTSSVQEVASVLAALTRAEIPVVQLAQGATRR